MSDLLKLVKTRLEQKVCPVHQKKAIITVRGENLTFDCCCESFREITLKQMKVETERATLELISKMFNK